MRNTFLVVRWVAYAWCVVCAISVLGISANLAVHFLGIWSDRPFIIFALVCSILTICGLTLLSLRSQPRLDVIAVAVLCILWLALGAYSADIIGYVQCETLSGQRKLADHGGGYSSMAWCRQMKAILAFSFATFGVMLICLIILLALIISLHARGQEDFWGASMSEVPWFGQYDNRASMAGAPQFIPSGGQYVPNHPQYSGNVVYQQPGHEVIIENGQIRQVPVNSGY